jgi:hypothetical protein
MMIDPKGCAFLVLAAAAAIFCAYATIEKVLHLLGVLPPC